MGSETGQDNERPVHRVWIDAFELAATQVTRAEYGQFLSGDWPSQASSLGRSQIFRNPISQWLPFPGSMQPHTANGSPESHNAVSACLRKRNGSARPAEAPSRSSIPGVTILRSRSQITPRDGKQVRSPWDARSKTRTACLISPRTSTNGAPTGLTQIITAFQRSAIRGARQRERGEPRGADRGGTTRRFHAAPPVRASLPNFSTPTTASASPVTSRAHRLLIPPRKRAVERYRTQQLNLFSSPSGTEAGGSLRPYRCDTSSRFPPHSRFSLRAMLRTVGGKSECVKFRRDSHRAAASRAFIAAMLILAFSSGAWAQKKKKSTTQMIPRRWQAAARPGSDTIEHDIGEMLGAFQVGDVEAMHKYYSDNVIFVSAGSGPPVIGWKNYVPQYQAQKAAFQGMQLIRRNTLIFVHQDVSWATYQWEFDIHAERQAILGARANDTHAK